MYYGSFKNLKHLVKEGEITSEDEMAQAVSIRSYLTEWLTENCYTQLPSLLSLQEKMKEQIKLLRVAQTLYAVYEGVIHLENQERIEEIKKLLKVKDKESLKQRITNLKSALQHYESDFKRKYGTGQEPQVMDFYNDLKIISIKFKTSPSEDMSLALYASYKKDLYAE